MLSQIVAALVIGNFQVGSCVLLMYPPFFSISLLSGTIRCSRLTMYFPCSSPRISSFSEEPFYWRIVFRNQVLSSWCAFCYWGVIASTPSLWTELGNIYMYTYPCICTYLYLFQYLSICIYT